MSDLTPVTLFDQAFWLYRNQEYAQALNLLTREASRFPERAARIQFWRACMAARMGDTPLALGILQEAVGAGHWYSEMQLRDDEDMAPLQGLPEYEQLVEVCLGRFANAQAQAVPKLVTREPEAQGEPWPLLMALHGNSGNAADAAERWGSACEAGWLLAVPQSSRVGGPDAFVWDDRRRGEEEIREHLLALSRLYAIDRDRVVVGGFSRGGGLAVWLAVAGAIEVAGFVAVAPALPKADEEQLAALLEGGHAQGLRGCIIVGEQDDRFCEAAVNLAERLKVSGVPCELRVYPDLSHAYPPDFGERLPRALDFVLRG